MTARAYPLQWPDGQPRTPDAQRKYSRFQATTDQARNHLYAELERMRATNVVLSTNMPTRRDGEFYASAKEPDDSGVAVFFHWRGRPYSIGCDTYPFVRDNVRALGKTIEAMRSIERHGATSLLERAVSGFSALPPGAEEAQPQRDWWEVLGLPTDGPMSAPEAAATPDSPMRAPVLAAAESIWRQKQRTEHPDRGGSHEAVLELNRAIEEARAALGGSGA